LLASVVVTPKGGVALRVARFINAHIAVIIKMLSSASSARLAARNGKLGTAHAEVGLDVHTHQHSDAEMTRPPLLGCNRYLDPKVVWRRDIKLRFLRRGHETQAGKGPCCSAHHINEAKGGHG